VVLCLAHKSRSKREKGRVRHPTPNGMGWQGKRLRRREGFKFATVQHFSDAGNVLTRVT